MNILNVVKIQRFSTHDGPGVRTVVFLKGCPLRCKWCHNPEAQKISPQIFFHDRSCIGCGMCMNACDNGAHIFDNSGRHLFDAAKCNGCHQCTLLCPANALEPIGSAMTVDEIMAVVKRDSPFYGTNGGITLSGGEPMSQPEGTFALLKASKESGFSTAVETCGYFDEKFIAPLCKKVDYLIWDLKDGINERHFQYTGVYNKKIISNLLIADKQTKHILIRCIMLKGVNMDEKSITAISNVYNAMSHCDGIELIPYHAYGGSKAEQLGGIDNGNKNWIPDDEDMKNALNMFEENGCKVI